MPDEPRAASETRSLSLTALMALAQLPGLRCGALSPLARIAAPAGAPDRDPSPPRCTRSTAIGPHCRRRSWIPA